MISLFLKICAFSLVVALLGTGCGGGSDSSSDTTSSGPSNAVAAAAAIEPSSISKQEFIEKADEICSKESEEFLPLILNYIAKHENEKGRTQGEITQDGVEKLIVPKFQSQIDQIKELGAPEGDEKEIEAFLRAMQTATWNLEKRNELNLSTDIDREFATAGELAIDYGLQSCAN